MLRRVPVLRLRVPVERDRVVPVARRRAVVRPPFADAARDGDLRVVVLRRVDVLRPRDDDFRAAARPPFAPARLTVIRPVLLRRVLVVLRRVPVLLRRVPVARFRAVARPPLAAAARDGARRVLLRLRDPVELELLERRRVPPVERERDVVLRERDVEARRVPVERDRLVVERRRPLPVDAATREMLSSCGCSSC